MKAYLFQTESLTKILVILGDNENQPNWFDIPDNFLFNNMLQNEIKLVLTFENSTKEALIAYLKPTFVIDGMLNDNGEFIRIVYDPIPYIQIPYSYMSEFSNYNALLLLINQIQSIKHQLNID